MQKRILIADDDSMFVKLLTYELERRELDMVLQTAENGKHALELIEAQQPDVLLLDLRMPIEDGFSVLEKLQALHSKLPVIVLTHFQEPEYEERSKALGAKELIVKSHVTIEDLVDRLMPLFV